MQKRTTMARSGGTVKSSGIEPKNADALHRLYEISLKKKNLTMRHRIWAAI